MTKRANVKSIFCFIGLILFLLLIACSSNEKAPEPENRATGSAAPVKEGWQAQWESLIATAKKERKVSLDTSWGPETREAVIKVLKEKYGIDAEVLAASGSQTAQKIIAERRAGLYMHDISIRGANTAYNVLKPAGVFDLAETYLLLPEVKGPEVWLGGKFPWFDRDQTMIPFFARLDTYLSINTDLVKQGEVTSYKDLLEPKWKGKIILRNPTIIGPGSGWFRENGRALGLEYMKALVKQEPQIVGDDRTAVEWLARGKYSILIAGSDMLTYFMQEGAHIAILDPIDSRSLSPSSGIVSILNNPPHPNAARLFLNWILTREGQTIMTKTTGFPSRRLDVPTEHILPVLIPQSGKKYIEYTEESLTGGDEAMRISKEIFAPLLSR